MQASQGDGLRYAFRALATFRLLARYYPHGTVPESTVKRSESSTFQIWEWTREHRGTSVDQRVPADVARHGVLPEPGISGILSFSRFPCFHSRPPSPDGDGALSFKMLSEMNA